LDWVLADTPNRRGYLDEKKKKDNNKLFVSVKTLIVHVLNFMYGWPDDGPMTETSGH
jgi:uncharacterized damage-inducible protein DinB